jgi:hypothetical protein
MSVKSHLVVTVIAVILLLHMGAPARANDAVTGYSGGIWITAPRITAGWEFNLNATVQVTDLGMWSPGVLYENHDVGIWDHNGTLLCSTTVLMGDPMTGSWAWHSVAGPVLGPGDYVIGAYLLHSWDYGLARGVVATDPAVTYVQDRFSYGPGLMCPVSNDPSGETGYFGPNFRFDVVPEPAFYQPGVLILLGGLGALLLRKRA